MKWPGSTLTDSRSGYHGKNEREGRAEPGQALRLIHGSGSDEGNGRAVARRVCSSVESRLKENQRLTKRERMGYSCNVREHLNFNYSPSDTPETASGGVIFCHAD